MQEPTSPLLPAQAPQPLHGHAIFESVVGISEGHVTLRAGALGGASDRPAERSLIEVDREETVDGRLRRYHRLGDSGVGALAAQVDRLRRNTSAAPAPLSRRPRGNAVSGPSFHAAGTTTRYELGGRA